LLLLDHLNSHLAPQFLEPEPPQWLGENVAKLLSSFDILNLNLPFLVSVSTRALNCRITAAALALLVSSCSHM
jgi:hypothetical protein